MRWFFLTVLAFLIAYTLVGSVFHYLLFREPAADASQLPAAGDVVDNPAMGVRVTLQKTAADTDGEYVQAEVRLKPGGGPPPHVHPTQTVIAEVLSGSLTMIVDDEERQLARGDTLSIPAGTAHHRQDGQPREHRVADGIAHHAHAPQQEEAAQQRAVDRAQDADGHRTPIGRAHD